MKKNDYKSEIINSKTDKDGRSHEYDDEQPEFLKDTYKWQKPMK